MEFLEKIENLQMFPSKREISRSNRRTGDNLSKRESPVQNGRVGCMLFVLISNCSVCFSKLKNLFHEAGINIVNCFIILYTKIPQSIYIHANFSRFLKNFLRRRIVVIIEKTNGETYALLIFAIIQLKNRLHCVPL